MSGDKYIAFDVHQATTVTSVLNADGEEKVSGTFFLRERCGRMPSWAESGELMLAA
jgi:hypothetical protein